MALASRKDPSGCCDPRPFGGPRPGQLHSWGINSLAMSTQRSQEAPRPTSVLSGHHSGETSPEWWPVVVTSGISGPRAQGSFVCTGLGLWVAVPS